MKNLSVLSLKRNSCRSTRGAAFTCHVALLLVVVMAATTDVTAQPASKEVAATRGRSIVRGRVVTHDTNRPLRRVTVSLYDPGNRGAGQHHRTWTDRRGEFVIKNVPAGKYYVLVDAPGIIRPEVYGGSAAMTDPDVTVVSVDGTSSAEVRVRAKRGGAITGRVTYADGEPAMSTEISLWRRKDGQLVHVYQDQQRYGDSATNERGDYRLSGLPPGEYVVGAGERKLSAATQSDEDGSYRISSGTVGYTYHGGTTSARAATTIRIDESEEADDIDITLVERGAHLLSGVVVARGDGRPVPRAEIQLRIKEEPSSGGGPSPESHHVFADAQGRWEISEVADGSYTLSVTPSHNYRRYDGPVIVGGGERAAPKFVAKRQDLIVAGGDQSGLVIEVSAGGRVSGIIAMDGGNPLPRRVVVHPEAAEGSSGGESFNQPPAEIQPDGTFALEGLPASGLYLNVSAGGDNRQGYYIKSAIGNGVDLLRSPLQLADGGEVKDVRVVLSANVATFTGRILAADGAPARGASVMLVLSDPDLQRRRGSRLYGQANAEGHFTVAGAPGEYAALVMRPDDRRFPLKADEMKERLANAPRVTLQPGENKRLDLTVPGDK